MTSKTYKGINHIFSNADGSLNSNIYLKPGLNESLNIDQVASLTVTGTTDATSTTTGSITSAGGISSQKTIFGDLLRAASAEIFEGYIDGDKDDVTGDGTEYSLVFAEVRDVGSNYDTGTGIYTCPYDGVYLISGHITLKEVGNGKNTSDVSLYINSTFAKKLHFTNVYFNTSSNNHGMPFCTQLYLSAGDELTFTVTSNMAVATKTADVRSGAGTAYGDYSYITVAFIY